MKILRVVILVMTLGMIIEASSSTAFADLVCLRSLIKNGKIKNTTKTTAETKCPRGYTPIVDINALKTAGLQGVPGPQGIQGGQGIQGPKGDPGPSGLTGFSVAYNIGTATSGDNEASAYVECPAGKKLIGGSAGVTTGLAVPASLPIALTYDAPTIFGTSYYARAYETAPVASSWQIYVFAFCADIS